MCKQVPKVFYILVFTILHIFATIEISHRVSRHSLPKLVFTSDMGQHGSKMHCQEPRYAVAYACNNRGNTQSDQHDAHQYRRHQQKREQKENWSRRNGIIAAAVGAA